MKLEKATVGDVLLSIFVPGWGLQAGLIALIKREFRRGFTMMAISGPLFAILAVPVFLVLLREPIKEPRAARGASIESTLAGMAAAVNRSTPRMIDADMRLDGAAAGPGRNLTFLYTLPKVKAGAGRGRALATNLVHVARKSACATMKFETLFHHNVLVRYVYRRRDGSVITTATFGRTACGM